MQYIFTDSRKDCCKVAIKLSNIGTYGGFMTLNSSIDRVNKYYDDGYILYAIISVDLHHSRHIFHNTKETIKRDIVENEKRYTKEKERLNKILG